MSFNDDNTKRRRSSPIKKTSLRRSLTVGVFTLALSSSCGEAKTRHRSGDDVGRHGGFAHSLSGKIKRGSGRENEI